MYYGRGDYRGGYYRGDPINILGGLVGGVKGFLSGGVTGAFKGAVGGLMGTGAPKTPSSGNLPAISTPNIPISTMGSVSGGRISVTPAMVDVPATTPGAVQTPGISGVIQRILPGGKSGYQVGLGGYHYSKSGKLVRNRRMNVTNPRALRRGLRRIQGFGKLVQRMKRAVGRANTAVGNKHAARRRAFGRR